MGDYVVCLCGNRVFEMECDPGAPDLRGMRTVELYLWLRQSGESVAGGTDKKRGLRRDRAGGNGGCLIYDDLAGAFLDFF